MGLFTPRRQEDDDEAEALGLSVALDDLACPVCRRDLRPWEDTCPEHGAAAVPRTTLPPLNRPPAHLLEE